MSSASFLRATLEGIFIVTFLFPFHFFAELGGPDEVSNVLILGLFFLPPLWGAIRLRPWPRDNPDAVLWAALFGFNLGIWGGAAGAVANILLSLGTGRGFLVPIELWIPLATTFALLSALAYTVIVLLTRGLLNLLSDPESPGKVLFAAPPEKRSVRNAVIYNLIPGLGLYYLNHPLRGANYLSATMVAGLLAFSYAVAAAILFFEATVVSTTLLAVSGNLLIVVAGLWLISTLDLIRSPA